MSSHSIKAFFAGLALGLVACGGSSSETPLPLPPHPLHEAYRAKRIAARAAPSADPVDDEAVSPEEAGPAPAGPPARSTWGADAPRPRARPSPVPELE